MVNATDFNQLPQPFPQNSTKGDWCNSILILIRFVPSQNVKFCQFCFKFLAKHAIMKSVVNLRAATVAIDSALQLPEAMDCTGCLCSDATLTQPRDSRQQGRE